MPEDLFDRPNLDGPTVVQHHRGLRDASDESKVVGDKDHRQLSLGLEPSQHLHGQRLDRDIERRRHLVAQEQVRLDNDGSSYGHSLTLSSGELVRITAHEVRCKGNVLQHSKDPRPAFVGRDPEEVLERLGQD